MKRNHSKNSKGISRLVNECRKKFERLENIDHYSEQDYKKALRKFIKYCLTGKPRS